MTWDDRDDVPGHRSRSSVRRSTAPLLPMLLIAIGVAAFLGPIFGGTGFAMWRVFWLAIGVWCLARGRDDGPYPLLVIGAFLVGNNTGELLGAVIGRGIADATETLGTAAGFLWLYFNDRPRSRWAIWPAAIIGVIGVGEFGFEVTELVAGGGGGWLLPAGVVVAGVLLLGAHRMPGVVRFAGLVFVAAAALSLLANNDDDDGRRGRDGRPGIFRSATTSAPQTFEIGERTVQISGNDGSVTVQEGAPAVIAGRLVRTDDQSVQIEPRTFNASVVVRVPAGTKLDIAVDNGSVTVLAPTANADIATDNGQIVLHVLGDPTIDAETNNGQIVVDNEPRGDDYEHDGQSGDVELDTDNGAIIVTRTRALGGAGQR